MDKTLNSGALGPISSSATDFQGDLSKALNFFVPQLPMCKMGIIVIIFPHLLSLDFSECKLFSAGTASYHMYVQCSEQ